MSDAAQYGPAERRSGIPRDLPDQEAAAPEVAAEEADGEDEGDGEEFPDTDEAGSGPRRPGAADAASGESGGDREPPEPLESTD